VIRVLIPDMPTADELLPWLRLIDTTRHYVKGGPLVQQLQRELAALTGAPCTAVANGTVSLELALRAMALPQGAGVLVPAVTFIATAQAIINAGLSPVLHDVSADTWQLDAAAATEVALHSRSIRCALPVASFGRAVPVGPWERFAYDTNLPVLIDAAGAIYDQQASPDPDIVVSCSLNATKAIGAGEGGIVSTCDLILGERVAQLANFGPGGTNARMSEYHAAVALASIRHNSERDWRTPLCARYAERLPAIAMLGPQIAGQSARTMLPALLPPHCSAVAVGAALAAAGVESRCWYRPLLDERPELIGCARIGDLAVTAMLRERLIGLPYHALLTEPDVDRVCSALAEAIA